MKPKIFLFNNGGSDGWYNCYSMAEDGEVLGNHICSHSGYMRHDLHDRPDRKLDCEKKYPDGYELVIVPDNEVKTHPEFSKAYELNQIAKEKYNEVSHDS